MNKRKIKKLTAVLITGALAVSPLCTYAAEDGNGIATYAEESVVEEAPVVETPVTEAPAVEMPATEAPVVETPVTEAPVVETPATEAQAENPDSTETQETVEIPSSSDTSANAESQKSESSSKKSDKQNQQETNTNETEEAEIETETIGDPDPDEDAEDTVIQAGDPNADVESQGVWESTLPELTGIWRDDILAIARSQMGYTESTRNYQVVNGQMKGYTRYGAWYGIPYGDWCAMFASFCIYYAGVPTDLMPIDSYTVTWIQNLTAMNLYQTRGSGYVPIPGDLIFFAADGVNVSHVGLVEEVITNEFGEMTEIVTIEGNSSNMVKENRYSPNDNRILGYGVVPEQPDIPEETEKQEERDYTIKERLLMMEHDVEIHEGKPASCTEDGYTEEWICTDCGEVLKEKEVIPFLDHTIVVQEEIEPTCSEPGLTKGLFCSGCGKVFVQQEEIPATGHDYEKTETIKTDNSIKKMYVCKDCGLPYIKTKEK